MSILLKFFRAKIQFPKRAKSDSPHYYICGNPKSNYLQYLLSLYLHFEETLPERSQLLFCSDTTTQEEFMLFIYRFLSCASNKLFCLIFAEKLPLCVQDSFIDILNRYYKGVNREKGGVASRVCVLYDCEWGKEPKIIALIKKHCNFKEVDAT